MKKLESAIRRVTIHTTNFYILHQDRRVVETHQPKASALRIGEFLVPGDYPMVEYRRRRAELQSERKNPQGNN